MTKLENLLESKKKASERVRKLNNSIKLERKRLQEIDRAKKRAYKHGLEEPFRMQVAKQEELKTYIRALRITVSRALKSRGATLKEVEEVLGITYPRVVEAERRVRYEAMKNPLVD